MLRRLSLGLSIPLWVCSTLVASNYTTAVLADRPIAYYRLGDSNKNVAVDSSGNGHSGLYAGGVSVGQPGAISGDSDTSAYFDGSTGAVNPGFNPVVSNVSIEVWIRPTRAGAPGFSQQLIAGSSTGSPTVCFGRTPGYAQFFLWPGDGHNTGSATSLGDWKAVQTSAPLPLNSWTYLVGTWNDATKQMSIYVNGVLSAVTPLPGIPPIVGPQGYPWMIGSLGNWQSFEGGIDEVAFYDYALSGQQILAHYNAAQAITSRIGVLSHLAAGGWWDTTITLINPSSATISATVNLRGDDGFPLSLPLKTTQYGSAQAAVASSVNITMRPNSGVLIATGTLTNSVWGWAEVLASGPLTGFAILRSTPTNDKPSEATVPLQTSFPSTLIVPYDHAAGYVMGVALVNLASVSASITATAWDDNGNQLGSQPITIVGNGHTAFVLTDQLSIAAGKRGMIKLQNSPGAVAALGLRFSPAGPFTNVPVVVP